MQKFREIPSHKCKNKINEECRNQNGKQKLIILEKKSGAWQNLLIKYKGEELSTRTQQNYLLPLIKLSFTFYLDLIKNIYICSVC